MRVYARKQGFKLKRLCTEAFYHRNENENYSSSLFIVTKTSPEEVSDTKNRMGAQQTEQSS